MENGDYYLLAKRFLNEEEHNLLMRRKVEVVKICNAINTDLGKPAALPCFEEMRVEAEVLAQGSWEVQYETLRSEYLMCQPDRMKIN